MKTATTLKFLIAFTLGFAPFSFDHAQAANSTHRVGVALKGKKTRVMRMSRDETITTDVASALNSTSNTAVTTTSSDNQDSQKSILPYALIGGAVLLGGVLLMTSMSSKSKPSTNTAPTYTPPATIPAADVLAMPTTPAVDTIADVATPSVDEFGLDDKPASSASQSFVEAMPEETPGAATPPAKPATITDNAATLDPQKPAEVSTIKENQVAADVPADKNKLVPPADIPGEAEAADLPVNATVKCIKSDNELALADEKLKMNIEKLGGMDNILNDWLSQGDILGNKWKVEIKLRKKPDGSYVAAMVDHLDPSKTTDYRPFTACASHHNDNEILMSIPQPDGKIKELAIKPQTVDGLAGFKMDDLNDDFWRPQVDFNRVGPTREVASTPAGVQ